MRPFKHWPSALCQPFFFAAKNPVLRLGHLPKSTSAYQQKKRVTAPRLIIRLDLETSAVLSQRSSYFLGYLVSALKRPQKPTTKQVQCHPTPDGGH